ncbi:hypothetical protein QFZ79_002356 [Arthrobacter sp. V4I6]|uniref:hypothetical protein n=1 Tax=unclassified Arthrobacter TaxID=235627 RepID=UPI00277FFD13|nr:MULTISPECIES: hypothetical protein [unclassified Arthrobacter]MDQ0820063.1 hypothetical protein [Arthrobacter sp. V1I7]MDQ0854245.1 hypothetical protein [Arthrobacter sp. V4I6]
MTEQDQDRDPWEEFDRLKPAGPDRIAGYPGGEPQGFGFRTGVRSAKVAIGFAVYSLTLGTVLVVIGVVDFLGRGQWLWLGLLVLIEVLFVLAFNRLLAQARNRRSSR